MGYGADGYKNLLTYKQGEEIYQLTKNFTAKYLDPIRDSRLKGHMDDSGRSIPRNITEGNKRGNTKAYLDFLGFSRASLEELKGDEKDKLKKDRQDYQKRQIVEQYRSRYWS